MIPLPIAVSASIRFSVSSCRIAAYLRRTRASSRGGSLLLCMAASKHDRPVAINFWYSSTWLGHNDMATSCDEARALSKHSSAIATIMGMVLAGRGLGCTAGDLLVMLGERVDNAGEFVTEE